MKASDSLFALIKSLNKSEKGYFKKCSNFHLIQNKKNNYIKLFTAIDSQKVYDESKLLKRFKGERFVKQFSVAKNYLYDIILESLEAYNKTTTVELRSLMNRCEFLISKRLYAQARKMLKRAQKVACTSENFSSMMEISLMEHRIHRLLHDKKALEENISSFVNEISDAAWQIENVVHYEKLKSHLYLQYIESGKAKEDGSDPVIDDVLFQNRELALSSKARTLFSEIHAMHYEYTGAYKKAYYYSVNVRELAERHPQVLETELDLTFTFLYQHSIRCSKAGLHDEALKAISGMEFSIKETEIQKDNRTLKLLHAQLTVNIQAGKINTCLDLIPDIKQLLEQGRQLDALLKEEINWQIISVLIIQEQYKLALNWFNRIAQGHVFLCQHLNYSAKIIEIILHYELENFDIIEYRLKSFHRALPLKDKWSPLENMFVSTFQCLIKMDTEGMLEFRERMKSFQESETTFNYGCIHFIHLVILSWLTSKAEDKKISEALSGRLKIFFTPGQNSERPAGESLMCST